MLIPNYIHNALWIEPWHNITTLSATLCFTSLNSRGTNKYAGSHKEIEDSNWINVIKKSKKEVNRLKIVGSKNFF